MEAWALWWKVVLHKRLFLKTTQEKNVCISARCLHLQHLWDIAHLITNHNINMTKILNMVIECTTTLLPSYSAVTSNELGHIL